MASRVRNDHAISPREMRSIRDQFGMTQREFAVLLGVERESVADRERGAKGTPKATARLARLYSALHKLGVPVAAMLSDDVEWVAKYVQLKEGHAEA